MIVGRLVAHDVECYCGIVNYREQEKRTELGYDAWWLSVDHLSYKIQKRLKEYMQKKPPATPVLGADYLINYLAFGPLRGRIEKTKESVLPVGIEYGVVSYWTPELLAEAEKIREELTGMPEYVRRRHVRDYLDKARMKIGPIAQAGARLGY